MKIAYLNLVDDCLYVTDDLEDAFCRWNAVTYLYGNRGCEWPQMAISEGNSSVPDKIDVGVVHIAGEIVPYANKFPRCAPTDRPLIISLKDERTLKPRSIVCTPLFVTGIVAF